MFTLSISTYNKFGTLDPIENLVALKSWKAVYTFSSMFKDSLSLYSGDIEIQSYIYLALSDELVGYLLYNHGGYKPNSTIEEQSHFLHCRFVNVLNVIYPWFNQLHETQLIRYSKDRVKIEWIDEQIKSLILSEFEYLYYKLDSLAQSCFHESEKVVSKQELLDYVKTMYGIS